MNIMVPRQLFLIATFKEMFLHSDILQILTVSAKCSQWTCLISFSYHRNNTLGKLRALKGKDKFTQKCIIIIYSHLLKVRESFVVHETFLDFHDKISIESLSRPWKCFNCKSASIALRDDEWAVCNNTSKFAPYVKKLFGIS